MNFAQLEYPLFLACIVLVIAFIRNLRMKKAIVLIASLYFYAYWDYRFLSLLLASTLWDWSIGLALGSVDNKRLRQSLLCLSVIGNLGVLGFFKYYNFFIESAQGVLSHWGLHVDTLAIILPIGISFYTFQTLSYSIDVYRRHLSPCRSLLDFALYVTFFPQLVAGPIVRACEFLPQLRVAPRVTFKSLYPGASLILRGMVKKVLIADQLAMMVDPVFETPQVYSTLTVVLAIFAYAGQIYGDFSGYSDIAIGSARLLGFELPENFSHPYLAISLTDFWRRWHITLSTWLRDYLYIPLGGSRYGTLRTYLNLIITMFLGGLWHGAAWNFVAWGMWHGLMLAIERMLSGTAKRNEMSSSFLQRTIRWAITMAIVLFGWMLFRSTSLSQFEALLAGLMSGNQGVTWLPPLPLIALGLLVVEHGLWTSRYRHITTLDPACWYTPWLVGFALAALALFASGKSQPFVYFQF
jgi:alginate O-acetyltransferase complex protein AlgI